MKNKSPEDYARENRIMETVSRICLVLIGVFLVLGVVLKLIMIVKGE